MKIGIASTSTATALVLLLAVTPWVDGCHSDNIASKPNKQSANSIEADYRKDPPEPPKRRAFSGEAAPDASTNQEASKESESLSPEIRQIAAMARTNASETAMLDYIDQIDWQDRPSLEESLYLYGEGVPTSIITALQNQPSESKQPQETEPQEDEVGNSEYEAYASVITDRQPPPDQSETNTVEKTSDSAALDQTIAATAGTDGLETYDSINPLRDQSFYHALRPYGKWIKTDPWGWCWQPSVAMINQSWRPYYDGGRWLYTDTGWYWQSDYPWGWITFHHGRWDDYSDRGWVWVPGKTWAPAWVAWRETSQYCGWAPLPPRTYYDRNRGLCYRGERVTPHHDFGLAPDSYTFVPHRYLHDRHFYRHRLSPAHVRHLCKTSRFVHRFEWRSDHIVANRGLDPIRIARASRTRLPPVTVRELPHNDPACYPDQLARRNAGWIVYRGSIHGRHSFLDRFAHLDKRHRHDRTRDTIRDHDPQRHDRDDNASDDLDRRLRRIVDETPTYDRRNPETGIRWTSRRSHYQGGSLSRVGSHANRHSQSVGSSSSAPEDNRDEDNDRSYDRLRTSRESWSQNRSNYRSLDRVGSDPQRGSSRSRFEQTRSEARSSSSSLRRAPEPERGISSERGSSTQRSTSSQRSSSSNRNSSDQDGSSSGLSRVEKEPQRGVSSARRR